MKCFTFHGSTQIGAVRPLKRLNAAARRALRQQLYSAHSGEVSGFYALPALAAAARTL